MNDDRSFTSNMHQLLEHSIEDLDDDVSRQLRQARLRALESYEEKHSYWKPAGGFALATMLLVAIGVWQFGDNGRGVETGHSLTQAMEDLELIATSDSLQLYEDLEFYQWLDVMEGNAG